MRFLITVLFLSGSLLVVHGCGVREDVVAPEPAGVRARTFPTATATAPWVLRVDGAELGDHVSTEALAVRRAEIPTTQPLRLAWEAEASDAVTTFEYRIGVDVIDPTDDEDPGWIAGWSADTRSWQRPEGFAQGTPNVVVVARDGTGTSVALVFTLQVVGIRARRDQRPLLLIDDVDESLAREVEVGNDQAWSWNLRGVQGFSEAVDVIDTREDAARLDFAAVNDYRGVIWRVGSGPRTFFARAFAPRQDGRVPFHWFQLYQERSGNVLLIGPGATTATITPAFDPNAGAQAPFQLPIDGMRGVTGSRTSPLPEFTADGYPAVAWCLEAVDQVVPADHATRRRRLRSLDCDAVVYARMAAAYADRYAATVTSIGVLRPQSHRLDAGDTSRIESLRRFATADMQADEIYDTTVFGAPVELTVRDCQIVMYEAVARMDVDDVEVMQPYGEDDPTAIPLLERRVDLRVDADGDVVENCPAVLVDGRTTSVVSGAPIAIASTQYVTTKQGGTVPFEDYLFGFDLSGFDPADVKPVVEWILLERWGLNDE